jgi:protein-tyrosine-phosphatase
MAEAILRGLLAGRGVDAEVRSAGLYEGGAPATATARAVLAARGLDLSAHRSRALDDAEVGLLDADLIVGMERRHVQEAAVLGAPQGRCFTLPELARLAREAEPRRPGEALAGWATRLAGPRSVADFVRVGSATDEIADPIGKSQAVYEATVVQLTELLTTVVDRAFPLSKEDVA